MKWDREVVVLLVRETCSFVSMSIFRSISQFNQWPSSIQRRTFVFVRDKSILENKPFVVDKSIPRSYLVKCTEELCLFKMLFRGNFDGIYQLVELQEHNCQALEPTVKRAWVREKIMTMIHDNPRLRPRQLQ